MIFMFIRFVLSGFLIWKVAQEAGPWTGLCMLLIFIALELENFKARIKVDAFESLEKSSQKEKKNAP